MRSGKKGLRRKDRDGSDRVGKHGHHKSRADRYGHLRSLQRGPRHHSENKLTGENAIEFLKNEARSLEEQLRSIQQRIRDMEEGNITSELKASIDPEICIGCGKCERSCDYGAISIGDVAFIDTQLCVGCAHCIERCKEGAISIKPEI